MPEPTIRLTMLAARARTPMARTSPSSVRPGVGVGVVESFTWRMPNGGRRHVPNDGHESDTSRRPPPFQLLPTQTASPRRIAVGPALTTRDRRTRRTPARWRGRHRRPQKGSACGGGLLSQRASFLNERPREANTGIPRQFPFKKGSLRAGSEVPSRFLRPSATARSAALRVLRSLVFQFHLTRRTATTGPWAS